MATARKKTAREGDGGAVIVCDSCLEIGQAEAFADAARKALQQPDAVTVDASQVETITTPCMQVLCALAQALKKREQAIQWKDPSERFREVAGQLGLLPVLGLVAD